MNNMHSCKIISIDYMSKKREWPVIDMPYSLNKIISLIAIATVNYDLTRFLFYQLIMRQDLVHLVPGEEDL